MTKHVLFIVTSADKLGERATGFHASEFADPYYYLLEKGAKITVASPKGGKAPIDPSSIAQPHAASVKRMLTDRTALQKIENTKRAGDIDFDQFDAIFFPGGHGAVVDLPQCKQLGYKVGRAYQTGVAVGAVCHGPGGLVNAVDAAGKPIIAGKRVNCFTDAEEAAINYTDVVPFLLESRFRELGGVFEGGDNFSEYAVSDARIITGQNPASAHKCAELLWEAIV